MIIIERKECDEQIFYFKNIKSVAIEEGNCKITIDAKNKVKIESIGLLGLDNIKSFESLKAMADHLEFLIYRIIQFKTTFPKEYKKLETVKEFIAKKQQEFKEKHKEGILKEFTKLLWSDEN